MIETCREAVRTLLASGAPDRRLRARAGALEKLHDDIARFVRWPALQASLGADVAALRAAMRSAPTEHTELDRQILHSIRHSGGTDAAHAEAQRTASGRDWRKLLDRRTQHLRRRGLIRHAAGRWVAVSE